MSHQVKLEQNINKPPIILKEGFVENAQTHFDNFRDGVIWDERMKARKTASFGVSYNYSGITYPKIDMPRELVIMCERIENVVGFRPNNCLMNYYIDGDSSMGYHSDSSEELFPGTGVAIISFGAERNISYRYKRDKEHKVNYLLKSGALLYMNDQVQREWMHAIPKEPGSGARISLTFRNIIK